MRAFTTTLSSANFALNAARDSAFPDQALASMFDDLSPEFAAELLANPGRMQIGTPARNQITVDEPPFGIWFAPSKHGAPHMLDPTRYSFYQRATAETLAEHFTHREPSNGGWQGTFSVVDVRERAA